MKPANILKKLRVIAFLIGLSAWIALSATGVASPKSSPKASPEASPAASPAEKAHPFPFPSTMIVSVDKMDNTFVMGKKTTHKVHVLPETKITKDEKPAGFDALAAGMEIRGSVHKRADGDYDAVSIKIGPKPSPSPSPAQ